MAIGPGVDSAITVIFIISSWVIHRFFSTQVFSIREIMAYPPPKVNKPILAKDRKRSKKEFISLPPPGIHIGIFEDHDKDGGIVPSFFQR